MARRNVSGWLALMAACPAVVNGLEATLQHSFNPGVGLLDAIGVDEASGHVFVHHRTTGILVLQADGTQVDLLPAPGNPSNDFDLDFALTEFTIGGISVPAGSLLVFNGDDAPEKLYGVDPLTGSVLASVNLATLSMVGGAHVPALNAVVAVDYTTDQLRFLDANDGSLMSLVTPQLPFDVNYGDVDYATESGHLLMVSSNATAMRELDTAGLCQRDIDLSHIGVGNITGVALDETRGDYWFSSTNGSVYRVRLEPSLVDTDGDGLLDEHDNCINAPNPDQTDTDADGIGNACDADLNNDCVVNFLDLGEIKAVLFTNDADADLNGDGAVNFLDVGIMKSRIFLPPGPSGEGGPCGCGL